MAGSLRPMGVRRHPSQGDGEEPNYESVQPQCQQEREVILLRPHQDLLVSPVILKCYDHS